MTSYWWPLASFVAAEPPAGASAAAAAAQGARSGQPRTTSKPTTTTANSAHGGPSSAADLRHLAHAAFHTSLDGLLVESTKHRSLVVLRDAVLETRQRQYDPASLFDTLCIACSLLAERSAGTSSGSSSGGAVAAAKTYTSASGGGSGGGGGGRLSRNGSNSALPALGGVGGAGDAALETSLLQASIGPSSTVPALAVPHVLHYRHHAAARTLLLQSIGDVGKLIALGLLPVTQQVGQRVADLVRELAFIHVLQQQQQQQQQSMRRGTAGFGPSMPPSRPPLQPPPPSSSHTTTPRERELPSGLLDLSLTSVSTIPASAGVAGAAAAAVGRGGAGMLPAQLVHDDPVLVRLLQMLASAASSCPLGSPALAELYGTLLRFYCGVTPQSMLEATCEATLTHHIHSVLTALHDSASVEESNSSDGTAAAAAVAAATAAPGRDDTAAAAPHRSSASVSLMAATFTAQLQGVAFVKDICRLMIGARTRWLSLCPHPSTAAAAGGGGAGGGHGGSGTPTPQQPPLPAGSSGAGPSRGHAGPSSIAGITARVVADADRQRAQQQQQQRTPRPSSAASTPTLSASALPAHPPPPAVQLLGREGADGPPHGVSGATELPSTSSLRHPAAAVATTEEEEVAPERLRLFLLRTVTLFFKEQAKTQTAPSVPATAAAEKGPAGAAAAATSMSSVAPAAPMQSPLYMQCLNDCFFSVALWGLHAMGVAVPMQPPPPLFVEALRHSQQPLQQLQESPFTATPPPLPPCSLELFTCTQQLALVCISTHLRSMTNATQVLLEAHVRLLQRLGTRRQRRASSLAAGRAVTELSETAERLVQAATAVLSLWRKTLTSTSLLWDLLQVQSVQGRTSSPTHGGHHLDTAAALLDAGAYRDPSGDTGAAAWPPTHTPPPGSPLHRQLPALMTEGRRGGPRIDSSDSEGEGGYGGSRGASPSPGTAAVEEDGDASDASRGSPHSGSGGGRGRGGHATDSAEAGGGGGGSESDGSTAAPTAAGSADMPSLIRCMAAVLKLVVAHMQPPARRTEPTAAPGSQHDPAALEPAAVAAETSLTFGPTQPMGPFLMSITPPHHQLPAEDSGLGDGEAVLPRSPRESDDAAGRRGGHGAAAGVPPSRPLCLCATSGAAVYQCFTEALNTIATFGQFFSQLVDTQQLGSQSRRDDDGDAGARAAVLRRCRACFLGLHPHLLRCTLLCLRHLRYEEDVLPVVLKATGYWVQVSCALQLAAPRDAYLTALVDVLRTADPVVGHLVALSSPAAAGMSDAAATHPNTAVLEGLLRLHDAYVAAEPVVPGSVAAAALGIPDDDDAAYDDDSGLRGRGGGGGGGGGVQAIRRYAQQHMPSWGAGWLHRRRRAAQAPPPHPSASLSSFSARPLAGSSSRTVSPSQARTAAAAAAAGGGGGGGGGAGLRTGPRGSGNSAAVTAATAAAAAAASSAMTGGGGAATTSAAAASHASSSPPQQPQQPQQQHSHLHSSPVSSAVPSSLVLQGWHAPPVQHVVILGVCRLQHKVFVMKTLHVIANTLGAQLDEGWALLARGLVVTEPLLHKLKRLLAWVEEAAVEEEQQAQLLSDASHLRDALRSLCVNNTCQLPARQLDVFMGELVRGTAELSMTNASDTTDGGAREANTWSATSALQAPAPYVAASAQLPRQDPQGCADQWVLTSECLCVSLLSMLPFTEQQQQQQHFAESAKTLTAFTAFAEDGDGGSGRDGTKNSNRSSPLATPQLLQRQCTSALARAMRLWELETHVCRHVTDRQKVEQWGTTLLTTVGAHKRALLSLTAGTNATTAAAGSSGGGSGVGAGPESGAARVHRSLSEEETRVMEGVLATVVGHIAVVAAQLCRSAARRRRASERSGSAATAAGLPAPAAAGAAVPASAYQVTQSAALGLVSGPFAGAPLTQVSNALFAAGPAAGISGGGGGGGGGDVVASRLPLLPCTQADAASQSTSALLAALHRSTQAIALHTPLDDCRRRSSSRSRRRAGSAGTHGHTRVDLDPLEQLLASPFGLLDSIYAEWRRAGAAGGSSSGSSSSAAADVPSAHTHAAAAGDTFSSERAANDSGVSPDASAAPASQRRAAAVVAGAVPQLLDNAAGTILVDVVKLVQAYGESIDGAAWEAILSLLQRTATCPPTCAVTVAGGGGGTGTDSAGTSGTAAPAARADSGAMQSSVRLDDSSTALHPAAKPGLSGTTAAPYSSQAVESLNTAFRALESIQHNHIPHLNAEGLHRLIVCVGAFTVHRVDSGAAGERKLHTNLSAVQLLWSIADYLAAFGAGGVPSQREADLHEERMSGARGITSPTSTSSSSAPRDGGGGTHSQQQQQQQDRLWCSLLWQLRIGCLDDRQEVRQSALQTLFALVQTYGWRFSAVCWRCVLRDVLLPLMEVVTVATELCATPPPTAISSSSDGVTAGSGDGARGAASASAAVTAAPPLPLPPGADEASRGGDSDGDSDGDAVARRRLLRSLAAHPPQLEEVRVTLYDAGSRLFVTHYAHMRAAAEAAPLLLSSPSMSAFAGPGTDRDDATVVLERFLGLCGDVCVVVRGTSGEASAVAAVHALHGVLVEMPGPHGLHERGVDLAWLALERLLLRGGADGGARATTAASAAVGGGGGGGGAPASPAPYAHTEAKQCTLTVVAATVAAVCDSFRLQRHVAAAAAAPVGSSSSFAGGPAGCSGGVVSPFSSPLMSSSDRRQSSAVGGGFSSYFSGWAGGGGGGGGSSAPAGGGVEVVRRASAVAAPSSAQYFTRLLCLLQAVPRCPAVVSSYYFPSKAQATLLEGVTAVWPTLSSREARMVWGEVLLPAFPSAASLQRFVLQEDAEAAGTTRAVDDAASTLIPLKSVMPPGSHPGYLSAVMETMRQLLQHHHTGGGGGDGAGMQTGVGDGATGVPSDADRVRLAFMAPSTVQVTGTLLLLHLASAAALAGPPRSGSVPFTLPALFLQECVDLLQYTLWGPVLGRDVAVDAAAAPPHPSTSGAAVQCRRDGVAALCRVFELLLTATSTVVRHLDAATAAATTTTTTMVVPPHVTAALQALELLVDTLGEVVHHVMEHFDDVVCATSAINVLSGASTAEGLALARVARRSLSLLQRWAGAVGSNAGTGSPFSLHERRLSLGGVGRRNNASPPVPGAASPTTSRPAAAAAVAGMAYAGSGAPATASAASPGTSRRQLQDVVRASMESRNRAILRQYVDNPDDASAAALLVDTLRDVLAMAEADARSDRQPSRAGVAHVRGCAASAKLLRCLLPELLQLVACGSRAVARTEAAVAQELEMRALLAKLLALAVDTQPEEEQQQPQRSGGGRGHETNDEGDTSII